MRSSLLTRMSDCTGALFSSMSFGEFFGAWLLTTSVVAINRGLNVFAISFGGYLLVYLFVMLVDGFLGKLSQIEYERSQMSPADD